ncbi:MAG: hypothetical protein VX733_09995 [Candidatus Latescibacterota bacterium]|nr:hypothetical protein [Candidatus Latescibacterota bacterium]
MSRIAVIGCGAFATAQQLPAYQAAAGQVWPRSSVSAPSTPTVRSRQRDNTGCVRGPVFPVRVSTNERG